MLHITNKTYVTHLYICIYYNNNQKEGTNLGKRGVHGTHWRDDKEM